MGRWYTLHTILNVAPAKENIKKILQKAVEFNASNLNQDIKNLDWSLEEGVERVFYRFNDPKYFNSETEIDIFWNKMQACLFFGNKNNIISILLCPQQPYIKKSSAKLFEIHSTNNKI